MKPVISDQSAALPKQRSDPEGEMRGESQQGDTDEAQEELPAPIIAAYLRIKAIAVVNEIAKPGWGKQHEKADGRPGEKHGGIERDDAEYAAQDRPCSAAFGRNRFES